MWRILASTFFYIALITCAKGEELRALLEGPDKEIIYGDVVSLSLSLWPVGERHKYQDLLEKNIFANTIKVLNLENVEISKNNEEALVFTFLGVVLNKEIPAVIKVGEKDIQLMKRSLSVQEFHPEKEQVIIFRQNIKDSSNLLVYIAITMLMLASLAFVLFKKSLQRKKNLKREMEKYNKVIQAIEKLDTKGKVDYFFKADVEWLNYYSRDSWIQQKTKLESIVYKKEWLPEERIEIEKEVSIIIERIGQWSF